MGVTLLVRPDLGVVLLRYAGLVTVAGSQAAFHAAVADPGFARCRVHLVDTREATALDRDFVRFFALQAEIAGQLPGMGHDVLAVFLAPGPVGQAMAAMARRSWDEVSGMSIRVALDPEGAAGIMGMPVDRVTALLTAGRVDAAGTKTA
jgi:hypothetical protein